MTLTAPDRTDALAERLFAGTLGALELFSVFIGAELGLYDALAQHGPLTAEELARRAGIAPRYAREWLEQQAVAGLLDVEHPDAAADARRYRLDAAHARVLVDPDDPAHVAPSSLAGATPSPTRPTSSRPPDSSGRCPGSRICRRSCAAARMPAWSACGPAIPTRASAPPGPCASSRPPARHERTGRLPRVPALAGPVLPPHDEANVDYTRAFYDAAVPYSDAKTYFNFPGLHEDNDAAVRASYGANHARLARVKADYDPQNLFRLNQNILPAA